MARDRDDPAEDADLVFPGSDRTLRINGRTRYRSRQRSMTCALPRPPASTRIAVSSPAMSDAPLSSGGL